MNQDDKFYHWPKQINYKGKMVKNEVDFSFVRVKLEEKE